MLVTEPVLTGPVERFQWLDRQREDKSAQGDTQGGDPEEGPGLGVGHRKNETIQQRRGPLRAEDADGLC